MSRHRSPLTWLRRNLFRTWVDSILTIVFGALAVYALFRIVNFVFVTGRWEIIRVNLRLLMVGRFPETHELRLVVTVIALAAWGGFLAGFLRARQIRSGRVEVKREPGERARDIAERMWLPAVVILLLLLLSDSLNYQRCRDGILRRPAATAKPAHIKSLFLALRHYT